MEEQVLGGSKVGRTNIIFVKQFQVQKRRKMSRKGNRVRHRKSGQRFSPWMSYHAVFIFLVPSLIDILEVIVQGSNKSIFKTHSTNIWVFLVATFIYSFAFAADRKSHVHHTTYSQLLSAIAVISGSLSVASLVSMIVPPKFGHHSFILWAFVSLMIIACQYDGLVKHASYWVHRKTKKISFKFWKKFRGSNNLKEEQQLPV